MLRERQDRYGPRYSSPRPAPWRTETPANPLPPAKNNKYLTRDVELDIDIGADAKDWAAIQQSEKLKPVEAELRRIEETIAEVVSEMEYLRLREQKLRDTNESTNNRVKYFGVATTWLLIGLWAWQIMYLRTYFRCDFTSLRAGSGRWLLTEGLGRSISSELGEGRSKGLRSGGWRQAVRCLDLDVNDMGGLGQRLCPGCKTMDRKYDSHAPTCGSGGIRAPFLDATLCYCNCRACCRASNSPRGLR